MPYTPPRGAGGTRPRPETRSRRHPEARGRGEARSSPRALEAAAAPTDARRNARATRERERAPESLNGANRVDEIVPKRESRADETVTRINAARRAPRPPAARARRPGGGAARRRGAGPGK